MRRCCSPPRPRPPPDPRPGPPHRPRPHPPRRRARSTRPCGPRDSPGLHPRDVLRGGAAHPRAVRPAARGSRRVRSRRAARDGAAAAGRSRRGPGSAPEFPRTPWPWPRRRRSPGPPWSRCPATTRGPTPPRSRRCRRPSRPAWWRPGPVSARPACSPTGWRSPHRRAVSRRRPAVFPGWWLVALYGHRGSAALGVLGQQDLGQRGARPAARRGVSARSATACRSSRPSTSSPWSPTPARPGQGPYSAVSPRRGPPAPWVSQASAAGLLRGARPPAGARQPA